VVPVERDALLRGLLEETTASPAPDDLVTVQEPAGQVEALLEPGAAAQQEVEVEVAEVGQEVEAEEVLNTARSLPCCKPKKQSSDVLEVGLRNGIFRLLALPCDVRLKMLSRQQLEENWDSICEAVQAEWPVLGGEELEARHSAGHFVGIIQQRTGAQRESTLLNLS
jgi:hypothetical protein